MTPKRIGKKQFWTQSAKITDNQKIQILEIKLNYGLKCSLVLANLIKSFWLLFFANEIESFCAIWHVDWGQ